jgi:dTDP-4-amino-4,6-dideoxygalactose transaminase
VKQFYVGRPNLLSRERFMDRVARILDSAWYTNDGPFVRALEDAAAPVTGARHVVAVANATLGLELALEVLPDEGPDTDGGIGEILVPSFTFVSTVHAVVRAGYRPVFVEVGDDFCLDVEDARRRLTPATRAVVACDLFGNLCDRAALASLGLPCVFDSAHALGCGRAAGSIAAGGVCAVFSMHATKLVNSFEGGLIATESDEVAERLRGLRNNGFVNTEAREGRIESVGTNAKMSEIHAAMGLTNLEDIERIVGHNREVFRLYARHLPDGVRLGRPNHPASNFSYVVLRVDPSVRETLIARLREIGVNARSYFYPAHLTPAYRYLGASLPRTEALAASVIALPQGMSVDEGIIESIGRCMERALSPAIASVPTTTTMTTTTTSSTTTAAPADAMPAGQMPARPPFPTSRPKRRRVKSRALKAGV